MRLSVVVPAFNEDGNIRELYTRLKQVLEKETKDHEIIFVDDGSTDGTFRVMKELEDRDKKIKLIRFRANFGKSTALSSAFKVADGDVIITMDADLQDDPNDIPKFMEKIKDYDLVAGWRMDRHDSTTKKVSSRIYNRLTKMFTKVPVHDMNCGFKAYRKGVIKSLKLHGELHRYIPVLVHWNKYNIGEVVVNHHERKHGKSKYSKSRLLRGFLDLLTVKFLVSYSKKPFHLFGFLGLLFFFFGLAINAYLSYIWLMGFSIGERPLLILGVLLMLIGAQFVSLGLLGEMIAQQKHDEDNHVLANG